MPGAVRVGVGGWSYAPWRGVFYPAGLPHARELDFASRALTTLEINGTYYSTFKPATWRKWRDETPDGFVLAVKASRYCTNRKVLAESGPAVERFLGQGLTELGPKLGPINWQLAETKRFDEEDLDQFLSLLPKKRDGLTLRHAVEVRNPSFSTPAFYDLARRHEVAIVHAAGSEFPTIDEPTADFTYARVMSSREALEEGISDRERREIARQAKVWAKRGDVFVYFIAGAKVRNPAAAMALIRELAASKK